MEDAQVDVSSSQNCRTANRKRTVKRRCYINAVAKLDRTSMKKSASTCTIHCKIQVATFLGRNFVSENENRCADFTTRGRRRKVQGRPTIETSRRTRDQKAPTTVKTKVKQRLGPSIDHLKGVKGI